MLEKSHQPKSSIRTLPPPTKLRLRCASLCSAPRSNVLVASPPSPKLLLPCNSCSTDYPTPHRILPGSIRRPIPCPHPPADLSGSRSLPCCLFPLSCSGCASDPARLPHPPATAQASLVTKRGNLLLPPSHSLLWLCMRRLAPLKGRGRRCSQAEAKFFSLHSPDRAGKLKKQKPRSSKNASSCTLLLSNHPIFLHH